jgi:hypothetical protein
MNAYPAPAHRAVIGLAALGATALIIAASVVAPAKVDSLRMVPASQQFAPAAEAPVALTRIDVVSSRETTVVSVRGSDAAPHGKQQI